MDEAGTQPAENACVSQNGFIVLAKIEKPYTCGPVFRQPWFLIPLFALAGCFLTLCHCFFLDLFAKWACRRSCFLQHALLFHAPESAGKRSPLRSGGSFVPKGNNPFHRRRRDTTAWQREKGKPLLMDPLPVYLPKTLFPAHSLQKTADLQFGPV